MRLIAFPVSFAFRNEAVAAFAIEGAERLMPFGICFWEWASMLAHLNERMRVAKSTKPDVDRS